MSDQDDTVLSAEDRDRIRRSVETEQSLVEVLQRVMPEANEDEIGELAHDLADFWELALKHQQRITEILKMQGTESRKRLADLLSDLFYGDVEIELKYHVESVNKTFPKLIRKLESRK